MPFGVLISGRHHVDDGPAECRHQHDTILAAVLCPWQCWLSTRLTLEPNSLWSLSLDISSDSRIESSFGRPSNGRLHSGSKFARCMPDGVGISTLSLCRSMVKTCSDRKSLKWPRKCVPVGRKAIIRPRKANAGCRCCYGIQEVIKMWVRILLPRFSLFRPSPLEWINRQNERCWANSQNGLHLQLTPNRSLFSLADLTCQWFSTKAQFN